MAVVEPYNTVLSGHSLREHTDVTIMVVLGTRLMHQPLLSSRWHRHVRAASEIGAGASAWCVCVCVWVCVCVCVCLFVLCVVRVCVVCVFWGFVFFFVVCFCSVPVFLWVFVFVLFWFVVVSCFCFCFCAWCVFGFWLLFGLVFCSVLSCFGVCVCAWVGGCVATPQMRNWHFSFGFRPNSSKNNKINCVWPLVVCNRKKKSELDFFDRKKRLFVSFNVFEKKVTAHIHQNVHICEHICIYALIYA